MKENSFQDQKIPLNNNKNENSSFVNDDSLDWAKQAYLQLKQKQQDKKEERQKEIKEKEIFNKKNNVKENFESNIVDQKDFQLSQTLKPEDELQLGDFDDTFTWSAEVLAAQGKNIDQFFYLVQLKLPLTM